MIDRRNIVNSASRVFGILQILLHSNPSKNELMPDFSDDTLSIYLNTLKKLGMKINVASKRYPYYSLEKSLNFLNFNDNDIKLFAEIKEIFSKKASYKDIVHFNCLLLKLSAFTNENFAKKLKNIIAQKPFGTEAHAKIFELQQYIKEQVPVLITYNSPNSNKNYFKVMPKYLKLENSKLYLWCDDSSLMETRYLRADRINDFKKLEEPFDNISINNYAVCELANLNCNIFEPDTNSKILEKSNGKFLVKFYFQNRFEFLQKILYCGADCKIIEPDDLREKFKQKLELIKEKYER